MTISLTEAAYLYTLRQMPGISNRVVIRIAGNFSEPDSLLGATNEELLARLGKNVGTTLLGVLRNDWAIRWRHALDEIQRHQENGVAVIAFISEQYPCLLKLISDPPPLLFVRGNALALNSFDTVAIVGTRGPTVRGKQIAYRVARHFAAAGFAVVSGLAKGIDTEAHVGALEEARVTIAVLATPLDRVYPAANRVLSERIVEEKGVLVTEAPIGREISRAAFVRRNRIQSGLSLGVIPVQTGVKGGTMHTVRFAEKQGRLVFCPKVTETDKAESQNAGIVELVRSGRAREFMAEDYDEILLRLRRHREVLIAGVGHRSNVKTDASGENGQKTLGFDD